MNITLENYNHRCKVTQGGLKRLYLVPFVKYRRSEIKSDGMLLTEFPTAYIYQFDVEGTYNQQSSLEGGAYFFDQSLSVKLNQVYNILDIHKFLKQDYRVIAETNNGDLIMFGVRNGLECTTTNASGSSRAEFNGFNLEFKGKEQSTGLRINSFEDIGLYILPTEENTLFNYDLNTII